MVSLRYVRRVPFARDIVSFNLRQMEGNAEALLSSQSRGECRLEELSHDKVA
jgi:hypothetical protein